MDEPQAVPRLYCSLASHHLPPPSVPKTKSSSNPLGKERRGETRGALSPPYPPTTISLPLQVYKDPLLFKPETQLTNGAENTAVALPELSIVFHFKAGPPL